MDRALDEMLVQLGGMVLRLSSPQVTQRRRRAARAGALGQSVFGVRGAFRAIRACTQLKAELEETIKPRLRLVASR